MAQNTILATGSTAATSSDVVVAAGGVVSVGIYSAAGIPHGGQHHCQHRPDWCWPTGFSVCLRLDGHEHGLVELCLLYTSDAADE